MKKIFTLITIISVTLINTYSQSGTITYKAEIDNNNIEKFVNDITDPIRKSYSQKFISNLKKSAPYLNFTLNFNEQESLFTGKQVMLNDNGVDLNMAYGAFSADGTFYSNKYDEMIFWQRELSGKQYRVQMNACRDWKITNESKIIKGYKCLKATTSTIINNENLMTTAWFCPTLAYQFGPKGFEGLPGLILELNYLNRFKFYADQIVIKSKYQKIVKPQEGKLIAAKKFEEIIKKQMGFFQD